MLGNRPIETSRSTVYYVRNTSQMRNSQPFLNGHAVAATEPLSPKALWGAAMDVGVWLRSLGLGQYEATFRDSAIDVDVLADLTDGDLEKLGLPLGDRKRLLRAIRCVDRYGSVDDPRPIFQHELEGTP
jgi:SAM domain (Sterile alpha motif)